MDLKAKPVKYGRFSVIQLCTSCFARTHSKRLLYLIILVILNIGYSGANVLESWYRRSIMGRHGEYDTFIRHLINVLLLSTSISAFSYVRDCLFETHLSKYGAMVAAGAMKKILYSERVDILDLPGGQIEYYISEGSKEMAKIARMAILTMPGKIIDLTFECFSLYKEDKTDGKIIFLSAVTVLVIMTAIKFFYVTKTGGYTRKCTDISYEREKVYTEILDNITVVKAYGEEERSIERYKARSVKWRNAALVLRFFSGFGKLCYDYLGSLLRILLIFFYIATHNNVTSSDVVSVAELTLRVLLLGSDMVKIQRLFEDSYVLTGTILNFLELSREEQRRKIRVNMFLDEWRVQDVTYAARGRVIFSNVSMVLKRGDKAALFGRNGIGKSSIFKVLMNFDEFTGSVLMDGTDIRSFLMTDYRNLITYVPQDTRLFDDTIYENLSFGNDRSFEEIIEECKKMEIHDKIMLLPNGYNTIVGEGGKNLNGGLRQKIFYTRAFLREAEIYLFDEPTNNLDEANTKFLLRYINDPKYAKKTFLVICHDMDIVREFPKIYKFDEQKIVLVKG